MLTAPGLLVPSGGSRYFGRLEAAVVEDGRGHVSRRARAIEGRQTRLHSALPRSRQPMLRVQEAGSESWFNVWCQVRKQMGRPGPGEARMESQRGCCTCTAAVVMRNRPST